MHLPQSSSRQLDRDECIFLPLAKTDLQTISDPRHEISITILSAMHRYIARGPFEAPRVNPIVRSRESMADRAGRSYIIEPHRIRLRDARNEDGSEGRNVDFFCSYSTLERLWARGCRQSWTLGYFFHLENYSFDLILMLCVQKLRHLLLNSHYLICFDTFYWVNSILAYK